MLSRKDKPKADWTFQEWESWVNEATDMHRLALLNPAFLRVEMWRDEYARRKIEHEKMLTANGVVA
jgi:hypothetical protein